MAVRNPEFPASPEQEKAPASRNVDRVLSLLDLFVRSPKPLSITEISAALKVARGTAYSMVESLVLHRYLCRLEDKRYALSYQAFVLGQSYCLRYAELLPLRDTVNRTLCGSDCEQLVKSCNLYVIEPDCTLFALIEAYSEPATLWRQPSAAISRRLLPWYANAAGQVLAAFASQAVRQACARQFPEAGAERYGLPAPDGLEARFSQIRADGFSVDFSDYLHLNEVTLAAPVRNAAGEVAAALCFTCHRDSYQTHPARLTSTITNLGRVLSLGLGFRG